MNNDNQRQQCDRPSAESCPRDVLRGYIGVAPNTNAFVLVLSYHHALIILIILIYFTHQLIVNIYHLMT